MVENGEKDEEGDRGTVGGEERSGYSVVEREDKGA